MTTTVDALILDLLDWIGPSPRPYAEVIEAWRTSCPRLPVWEEATERGYVERRYDTNAGACVCVTTRGKEFLGEQRRAAPDTR
jgi:D-3-phosphoglycerate dehydrogenase / 2-oxoglutarate reductase